MNDREYWSTGGAWHALRLTRSLRPRAECGRAAWVDPEFADRVPADGHLCGSCARVIAARTDVER